jgi:AcrR family transcriptional regulator
VPHSPTGGLPGRPPRSNVTEKQQRFLLLELRIRFPDLSHVTFSDLIEPKLIFHKGEPGLSTREMAKRLGVSHTAIHKWRHDEVCQRRFCELIAIAIGRELGRSRQAPSSSRTKKQADDKLMKELVEARAAREAAKRKIEDIENIALGNQMVEVQGKPKPLAYKATAFLELVREWKHDGFAALTKRHPGLAKKSVTRALWVGDKSTEWFQSQEGDREPEPGEGDWKFEPAKEQFDGSVEFFKLGKKDMIRIMAANPGRRRRGATGTFKRNGKSVRKRIAKPGDVLEAYEGKATPEYIKRFPREWEAYQLAQRRRVSDN